MCLLLLRRISPDARHENQDDTFPLADNEGGETCEKKRPYIVRSQRAAAEPDRTAVTSLQVPRIKELSRGREPVCKEREQTAYEKIAGSLRLGRKR
jgi:hypothetical protein